MPTNRHDAAASGALVIRLFVIAAALPWFVGVGVAQPVPLEDQLALAREEENTYSEIELLRRFLDTAPEDASARRRLVELWLEIEDYDMAEAALAAWSNPPAGFAARTRATILFQRDKHLPGAIEVLEAQAAQDPQDVPTLDQLADHLGEAGRWAEQLKVMDALLAFEPSAPRLLIRANARRKTGDYTGAIRDAQAARALDSESPLVASSLPSYERLAQALGPIEKASARLESQPDDARTLLERGKQYLYGGIPDLALADAEAAEKFLPASVYARILKARALVALRQIDSNEAVERFGVLVNAPFEDVATTAALIQCDSALAKNPADAATLRSRASWLNHDIAQYVLAIADAEAALALNPKDAEALLDAIYASSMRARPDDAMAWLVRIEQVQPPPDLLARAYAIVSEMFFRSRELSRALEFAEKSLDVRETADMWRYKAACLQRMGLQSQANEANARAAQLEKTR